MNNQSIQELWKAACTVRQNAYAPYSNYQVGAALRLKDSDAVFTGCNVENASYGATICAERSAVMHAVSQSQHIPVIEELVLVTRDPAPPCGMCLQVLSEFCRPNTLIHLATTDAVVHRHPFSFFLPQPFSPDSL